MSDTLAPSFVDVAPLWALSLVSEAGIKYAEVYEFKITAKTITVGLYEGDAPNKFFRRNAFPGRS